MLMTLHATPLSLVKSVPMLEQQMLRVVCIIFFIIECQKMISYQEFNIDMIINTRLSNIRLLYLQELLFVLMTLHAMPLSRVKSVTMLEQEMLRVVCTVFLIIECQKMKSYQEL